MSEKLWQKVEETSIRPLLLGQINYHLKVITQIFRNFLKIVIQDDIKRYSK